MEADGISPGEDQGAQQPGRRRAVRQHPIVHLPVRQAGLGAVPEMRPVRQKKARSASAQPVETSR